MGHLRTAVPKRHFRLPKDGQPWGLDNGKYAADKNARPWAEDEFLAVLARIPRENPPFMAVCPDIVNGGNASLEFSKKWRSRLSELGYDWLPWYLAVQDGMDDKAVIVELRTGRWAGLFVGGSRTYKFETGWSWVDVAHRMLGIKAHCGGIYTPPEQAWARSHGFDSIDSTGWARNDTMEESITAGRSQQVLA